MSFARMRLVALLAAALGSMLLSSGLAARESMEVVGWVEKVVLEPYGFLVKARIDTGANTGSLHATNIERFERDGEEWVRFVLDVDLADSEETPAVVVERPVVRNIRIKEHDGGHDRRAVVKMRFCFGRRYYDEQFSLKDRAALNYPVLLGRRFLADRALVDSGETYLLSPRCEDDEAAQDGAAEADAGDDDADAEGGQE